jgi:hypothetical protein
MKLKYRLINFICFLIFSHCFETLFCLNNCGTVSPPKEIEDCYHKRDPIKSNQTKELDVSKEDDTNKKCCLLQDQQENNTFCSLIENEFESNTPNAQYTIDDIDYNIWCYSDYEVIPTGSNCGIDSPQSLNDCGKSSLKGNSCCLYHNIVTNSSRCFRMGRFTDEIKLIKNETNYTVACQCERSFPAHLFIYLLIFFILFN